MSLFSELKRRNVIRMAVLYVVAGWIVLQIADVLFDPLGLPDWSFRLVLGLLLLGFPFALIFAWVFELTPEGLKRERDLDRSRSIAHQTSQKMNTVIVVLLVVAIAGLVIDRLIPEGGTPDEAVSVAGKPAPETPAAARAAAENGNSIAVLPFVNISGDPGNEYFSDGLTEELLNKLVRIGGLKVTGRTSSFAFKGQNRDLREIGQLLNVANVLEGSVRKAGNRVRITAQLVKTADGFHLWSDTFDRELGDIFAIQQEIADQVTEVLHATLLGEAPVDKPVVVSAPSNPQAFEQYLRGLFIFQRNPDGLGELGRARVHFEQALSIDPGYVNAYWGMFLYWNRMNRNGNGSFRDSMEQMRSYAAELERLAPGSDLALRAAGRTALVEYRYRESEEYLAAAVKRYPGNAEVLAQYASVLTLLNDFEQAMEAVDQAAELDPLSLQVMRQKSFTFYSAGDCEGVGQVMQRAMELEPNVGRFRYYYAMCLFETTGDAARALPFAEAEPLGFTHDTALTILYHALGDPQRAQQQLDKMFVAYYDSASYQYGQIYAQWGEPMTALAWLENAIKIRDSGITQVSNDRLLIPLQDQPRFQQILKDAGF